MDDRAGAPQEDRKAEAVARARERLARDVAADARARVAQVAVRARFLGPAFHSLLGTSCVGPVVALSLHGGPAHAWAGASLGAALTLVTSVAAGRVLLIGGRGVASGLRSARPEEVGAGLRRIRVGALLSMAAPMPVAAVSLAFVPSQIDAPPAAGLVFFVAPLVLVAFGWLILQSLEAGAALRRVGSEGPVI